MNPPRHCTKRNPDTFREFIQARLQTQHNYYSYRNQRIDYKQLTKLAEARGDTPLIQYIRQNERAGGKGTIAVQALNDDSISVNEVLASLETVQSHLFYQPEFAENLMKLFERFGEPLLEFMLKYRWTWSRRVGQSRFTDKLETIYDRNTDEAYWRAFFQISDMRQWNAELRNLVDEVEEDDLLFQRLALMLPQNYNVRGSSRWQIDDEVAYNLIRRDKERAYPFIRAHTINYSESLFQLAVEMDDTDLLDTLIYRVLVSWNQETPQAPIDYLQNLLDTQPEQFIRRASNIFSHISAFEIYRGDVFLQRPLYEILVQPRELWLQSSTAIGDLLESPSIYVIYIGLELLAEQGELSARRTHENLFWIRSFLLGRAKRNTKALALDALMNASEQGYAEEVFNLLEGVKDFQGKRAIDDKILVAYGRLQRQLQAGEGI